MTNAHHAILDFAERHKPEDSPRTTCVACIVQDNMAYWAHAGDSRLYLMRGGKVPPTRGIIRACSADRSRA